jgi:hypothetical protein
MAGSVTNELLLEHMKRVQDRLSGMDDKLDILSADMRTLKTHMAGFMGTEVLQDTTIAKLTARIDRIERRLDLQDEA